MAVLRGSIKISSLSSDGKEIVFRIITSGRKTIKKRMRATLRAIKMELRKPLHEPIAKTGAWVYSVLKGRFQPGTGWPPC
jgi:CRP-like cAMP-binding protein